MAHRSTLKRLGMTDSEHRKQFFGVQDQRCAICQDQLVYGHACVCDVVTKTFFCRQCFIALAIVRNIPKAVRPSILKWASSGGKTWE